MSEISRILIIDDELTIRFVLKKLLGKYLSNVSIFTSQEGVQGVGYALLLEPTVIIVDSSLPKYSGRELVEFLSTNPKFKNTPIIVTYENEDFEKNLPSNYFQISKKSKNFSEELINLVLGKINNSASLSKEVTKTKRYKAEIFLAKLIIQYSNISGREYQRLREQRFLKRFINFLKFVGNQTLIGLLLPTFFLLVGRIDKEENIEQKKIDARKYRSTLYPALGFTMAAFLILLFQISIFASTFITSSLIGTQQVQAATKTWDGGGANNNWTNCANWNADTCPLAADTVVFSGTSVKNVTVNAAFAGTIAAVQINAGYTGVITLDRSFTVTTSFSQSAGTFVGAAQTMSVGTTFTLTGGTFTAPSTSLTVNTDFSVSGSPTFNASGGTVTFGAGDGTLDCNNITFNTVTFASPANSKIVNNTCTLPVGAAPSISAANFTLNGVLSGSGTVAFSGNVTLNNFPVLSGFSGLTASAGVVNNGASDYSTYSPFTFSSFSVNAGLGTFTAPPDMNVSGTFTVTTGNFISSSGNITVGGDFTVTASATSTYTASNGILSVAGAFTIGASGNFISNSGTVNFAGGAAAISCDNESFNLVSFSGQSGVKTIQSNCSFPLGNNPTIQHGITLNGTLSGTGTITHTTGTLTINSTGVLSGFSGLTGTTNELAIVGATVNFSSYNPVVIGRGFAISSSAVFTAPTGTMTVGENFTINATFNANGGTMNFDGSVNNGALVCNTVFSFANVTFTGVWPQRKTIQTGCTVPVGANPIIPIGINFTGGTMSGTGKVTAYLFDFSNASGGFSGFTAAEANILNISGSANLNFTSLSPFIVNTDVQMSAGTVTFPANGTLANVSLSGGTLNAPSSGNLTINFGLFSSNALTVSGGTFNGSGANITVNGNLSISTGGTIFNAPTATLSVSGNFTKTTGTFNHNSGTVNFFGGVANISCNGATFNLVTFTNQTDEKTISPTGSACTLPLGNNPTIPNSVKLNTSSAVLTGTGTLTNTTGTLTLRVQSTALSGFTGLTGTSNSLIVEGGTFNAGSYSQFYLGNSFSVISSGNFTAPSGTMVVNGDFTISATFNANGGTVNFTGGAATIATSGSTFANVNFSGQTGLKSINGSSTLPIGNNPTIPNSVTLFQTTLSGTGTLTHTTGTLRFENSGNMSGFNGITGTSNSVVINNSSLTWASYGTAFIPGSLTIENSGSLSAPSGTLTVQGNFSVASGSTYNNSSGTLVLSGGSANVSCGTITLSTFNIDTSGTKTFSGNCATGVFNLITGTMSASSGNFTVSGNFTLSSGTIFTHNSGTVTFSGGAANINCNNSNFGTVSFTGQSGLKTFASNCPSLPLGNNATIPNSVTLNGGSISGTGSLTHTAGDLTFSGGTMSGFSSFTANNISFSGSTVSYSGYSSVTVNGNLTVTSSSVTAPGGTLSVAGNYDITSSTFTHNSGTVSFTGGSATLNCNNQPFNSVNFSGMSGTKTVNSNCSLPLGNNPSIAGAIILHGTLSGTGTITQTGYINMNTGSSLSGFSGYAGSSVGAFILNGATLNASGYSTFTAGGFTINTGTFTAPTGNLDVAGDFNLNGGTFNGNGGDLILSGASSSINCGTDPLSDVVINSSGTETLTTDCTVNDFSITAGTFGNPASAHTLFVNGNFVESAATTFGGANLTVSFVGASNKTLNKTAGTFSSKFDVSKTGTAYIQLLAAFVVSGQVCTVNSGILHIGGVTFTCATGFSVASAGYVGRVGAESVTVPTLAAGSTVIYWGNGTGTATAYTVAAWAYSNLQINSIDGDIDTFTLNSNFSIASLTLLSGTILKGASGATFATSGAIVMNGGTWTVSTLAITSNGTFHCNGGTFTGSSPTLNINSTLNINGCNFSKASGTIFVQNDFNYNSGTLSNSGTLNLDGADQNINCATSQSLGAVTSSAAGTKTFDGNCSTNAFTATAGTITGPNIIADGLLTINGGTWSIPNFNSNGITCSSGTLSTGITIYSNGTVTISGCTFNAPANTLEVQSGNFTFTSGTFNNNSSSVEITGTGAQIITCGTATLYKLAINTSGTKTLAGNCTLDGDFVAGNGTIGSSGTTPTLTVNGMTWITGGTLTTGARTVNANGGITCSAGSWVATSTTLNTAGLFLINGCTFTAPAGSILVGGNFTISSGTYTHANGTLNFDGVNQDIRCGSGAVIYNLTISTAGIKTFIENCQVVNNMTLTAGTIGTDGALTNNQLSVLNGTLLVNGGSLTTGDYFVTAATLTCSSGSMDTGGARRVSVTGAFTVSGCTFTAPSTSFSAYLSVGGAFVFSSGTFNHNNGDVYLEGAAANLNSGCITANITTCNPTFYNLHIDKQSAATAVTLLTTSLYAENLIIHMGTLVQGALHVKFNFMNILSDGIWSNTSTGDVYVGIRSGLDWSLSNDGIITLQGTTTACNEADAIVITSTSPGTARSWIGSGTYNINDVSVTDQGGNANGNATVSQIAARSSTNGGNNANWFFLGCTNTAPAALTSLQQKKADDTVIATGSWTNQSNVKFTGNATDANNPDAIAICVEFQIIGTPFTNTENYCGVFVSYVGSSLPLELVTPGGLAFNQTFHWQARTKDIGGLYSAWTSFGGNAETDVDFGLDISAPTSFTVYDGTTVGVDASFNDGSGTSLSANWSTATDALSGLSHYEYSIGIAQGDTSIKGWTNNSTTTSVTATGLTLQTSVRYYFNVRAYDNAGNVTTRFSNGQFVAPSLSFSVSSIDVVFNTLNNSNNYSDTKTTTITTSTNSYNGYSIHLYKTDFLRSIIQPPVIIPDFSAGSYSTPAAWPGGVYGFGYTSNDTTIAGVNKFGQTPCLGGGSPPCFAPFSSTPPGDIVADHEATVTTTPIVNEQFIITYKVQTSNTQAAGPYKTNLIYSIIPKY